MNFYNITLVVSRWIKNTFVLFLSFSCFHPGMITHVDNYSMGTSLLLLGLVLEMFLLDLSLTMSFLFSKESCYCGIE